MINSVILYPFWQQFFIFLCQKSILRVMLWPSNMALPFFWLFTQLSSHYTSLHTRATAPFPTPSKSQDSDMKIIHSLCEQKKKNSKKLVWEPIGVRNVRFLKTCLCTEWMISWYNFCQFRITTTTVKIEQWPFSPISFGQ